VEVVGGWFDDGGVKRRGARVARHGVKQREARFKFLASLASLCCILVLSALEVVSLFPLALAIVYVLVSIKCITLDQAWCSISYRLLLTIACSFGPGHTHTHIFHLRVHYRKQEVGWKNCKPHTPNPRGNLCAQFVALAREYYF
jgi:hypothetical protein